MTEVEFFGETFTLNESVSEFALLEFSLAAAEGEDGDTAKGMSSVLLLLRDCIVESEWSRFRTLARAKRAKITDLMPIISAMFEQVTDRPTGRSSDSSDGPQVTEPKSESNSADKVLARFAGRPDLQAGIVQLREHQAQSA